MSSKAQLLEETRRQWDRSAPAQPDAGFPSPGDVVVSERTANFDVEWAVLAREPERPGQLLAVVADGQPIVGSADIEIPATSPGGPLVLRCRWGGWIDAEVLAPAARTASLDSNDVARARHRQGEVEREAVSGSILALEVDDDPDYRDWVSEILEPAWQCLAGEGQAATIEDRRPAARPVEAKGTKSRSSRRLWSVSSGPFALAATVLLALGGGLFWRQYRELRDLRVGAELAREEYQSEVEELRRGTYAINPAVTTLQAVRGVQDVRLPAGASHVFFFLPLLGSRPAPSYRAELLDAAGESIWASDGLREDLRELRIGFPATVFSPGEYTLRIEELREDGSGLTKDYALRIQSE